MAKSRKNYAEKFHSTKKHIDINDVNIVNILLSNEYHVGKNIFKYFTGFVNHSV